jgi:hypothetical protein
LSGSADRTRSVVFEIHPVFWQRHIGSYFSFSNQLKEVITILTGFNLGPNKHVTVTLVCYFSKKENSIVIHLNVRKQNKNAPFPDGMKLEFVTPLFITALFSNL